MAAERPGGATRRTTTCGRPFITGTRGERPCSGNAGCPFAAQEHVFSCVSWCVEAANCGGANPFTIVPDNLTGMCVRTPVPACRIPLGMERCAECFSGFALGGDGMTCAFDWDRFFGGFLLPAVAVAALALVSFVVWAVRSKARRRDRSDGCYVGEPGKDTIKQAILRVAERHHKWCKIRDWHSSASAREASTDEQRAPLVGKDGIPLSPASAAAALPPKLLDLRRAFFAVHQRYIVGLGMPLYYNFMLFMVLTSFVFFLAQRIYAALFIRVEIMPTLERLSIGQGNEHVCDHLAKIRAEPLKELKQGSVVECALLYVLGLSLACAFAVWQKAHVRRFLVQNPTMRMHAAQVQGLPPHVTDERALKEALEEVFSAAVGRPVVLAYVSICYDAWRFRKELPRLVERLVTIEDVRIGAYGPEVADAADERRQLVGKDAPRPTSREEWLKAAEAGFRQEVQEMFGMDEEGGASKLRCCNEAFAVFSTAGDCAEVLDAMGRPDSQKAFFGVREYDADSGSESAGSAAGSDPGGPPRGRLWHPHVCVFSPRIEPVGVCWLNYGKRRRERIRACVRAVVYVVLFVALLDGLILVNWARYKLEFSRVKYRDPSGLGSQVFGICIGTSNWLICVFLGAVITRTVGFLRTDREEVFIFASFTAVCILNTLVNVGCSAYILLTAGVQATGDGKVFRILDGGKEVELSNVIFNMLWPGCFTACLLWPLQGFIWPFLQAVVTLWAKDADSVSARLGESMLEPLPIGLAWDYQGCITTPILALLSMFLVTENGQKTLLYLTIWCGFFYCLQHVTHLRFCKIAYTTSNRLDTAVLYAWGLVLAEVAACSAWWGRRAYRWHWGCIPAAFCAGCAIYWLILWSIRPLSWSDDDDALAELNREALEFLRKRRHSAKRFIEAGRRWSSTSSRPGAGGRELPLNEGPAVAARGLDARSLASAEATSASEDESPMGSTTSRRSSLTAISARTMSGASIEETKLHTLYDWASCNSVLVLKSQVADLSGAGLPPLLPFVVGKSHFWEAWRRQGGPEAAPPPQADGVPYEPAAIYRKLHIRRMLG